MTTLRGVTWNNDRAVKPLLGTIPAWTADHKDISVEWSIRPLSTFAHQPLEELTADFDLIVLDHPHIGEGVEKRLIVPVEEIIESPALLDHHRATVGPTFRSYRWNDLSWAFPIDAACQVAVRRADLVGVSELAASPQWPALVKWAQRNPRRMGLPFNPVLSLMCLFSICASLGEGPCRQRDRFVSEPIGHEAIAILQELAKNSHEETLDLGDTATLDLMAESDEVWYVPLVFAYTNYSRSGYRSNPLNFEDIPTSGTSPDGSIIGGAGLAVSASSPSLAAAGTYCQWLASPEIQSGLYMEHFGQPASSKAWDYVEANRLVGNAFLQTRNTMERAYLRPTYPGYIEFQERCGPIVREAVLQSADPAILLDKLDQMHRTIRAKWDGPSNGDDG